MMQKELLAMLWKRWFVLLACALLMAGSRKIPDTPKPQILNYIQSFLDGIPRYPDALLIYRKYEYCKNCTFAKITIAYKSYQPWENVMDFYEKQLDLTRWQCERDKDFLSCYMDNQDKYWLEVFNVSNWVWEIAQRAHASGATVYVVEVPYAENWNAYREMCPHIDGNPPPCVFQRWIEDYSQ